ncbi:MAG TPA: VOC family protein [Thermoplasmata archaeon]|nr:VOC family protein [Thermoplasmata archaeon]
MARARTKSTRTSKPPTARRSLPKAEFVSVAVVVSDRKKSTAWYTKRLGLDVLASFDHWVTVGRKGKPGEIHLCQTSEYDTTIPLERGNTGIQLHLPGDFPAACKALAANGVKFSSPPKKEEWGWYAVVEDPDGNEISLTPA